MYKIDLPIDRREAAAIERRRAREIERQNRIFNAKTRLIGVDVSALNEQVMDKSQREQRERQRHEAFAADAIRNDKIASILAGRQEQDRKALDRSNVEFWRLHQQPQDRREWDLYDPDALKKDKPARVSDDDPRCGPASLQKFEGEDLNSRARSRYQQEQSREWWNQQLTEKEQEELNQKKADRLYDLKQIELDKRLVELQKAEEECRRAINAAASDYNHALADERRDRERLSKQQEQDDNATEVLNAIYSDMLSENPDVARSAFGPNRVVPDRWKGMSAEQLGEIRRQQQIQALERKRLEEEERLRNLEWDRQRVADARAAALLERQQERLRRQLNKQLAEQNSYLTKEQKAYQQYLDRELYSNQPTAAYFAQFNTTSR